MSTFDIIFLIFIIVIGLIIGWYKGMIKCGTDILALFISMIIASLLRNPICSLLYKLLPFFELKKNVFSLNIILYQIIIYVFLVLLIIGIYQTLCIKTGIDEKMAESSISSSLASRIVGMILGIPLVIIFMYNVLLVLNIPLLNYKLINDSSYMPKVLENTLLVSNYNNDLYNVEEEASYILYSKDNKKLKNDQKDGMILSSIINYELVSSDKISELVDKGSLVNDVYYEEIEEEEEINQEDEMTPEEEINEEDVYESEEEGDLEDE